MDQLGDLPFWKGLRDLRKWYERVSECRNPIVVASSVGYVLARRRLLRFGAGQSAALTSAYVREIEDDQPFLDTIRATLAQWTSYRPRAVDFTMAASWGSVFFKPAWPKVRPFGLLVADDVLANTAFFDFCRRLGLPYRHVFNLGVARARALRSQRPEEHDE